MKSIDARTKNTSGFSLVEIALALGVVGFALAALLGLLATASDVSADSGRETALVSMTTQIMADLRGHPFDALWETDPTKGKDNDPSTADPEPSGYFFTAEGTRLGGDGENWDYSTEGNRAESDSNVLYRCVVLKSKDLASIPDSTSTDPSSGDPARVNMLRLELQYEWPLSAPANKRQKYSIHATIARY